MDDDRHGAPIRIELEVCIRDPTGSATLIGGGTRTFAGWLGLMAVVAVMVGTDESKTEEPQS
jgi:hypothetical protein